MSKETLQFQTETKDLLNLMIHSIYTHKEIFLRELISNASDAMDKMKYESLTNPEILGENKEFTIQVIPNKEARTLTITDSGIGMSHEDLINNIGTIAKSGTKQFLSELKSKNGDINAEEFIGQFGVGFYSAFMVADSITLTTRRYDSETAYTWTSTGDGTFSVEEATKATRGTTITLHLRKTTEEDEFNYDSYLETYEIENLVTKYSDYIRYAITMDIQEAVWAKDAEGKTTGDKPESYTTTTKTLNSQVPLWKKEKSSISEEEYTEFYKSKFHDWEAPLETIHYKVEGNVEYTALLYIPTKAPHDFYSPEFKRGLSLYSKNVFIMEKCEELLPDYLKFVKGLVDSSDFSLNISREILQQSKQLKVISKNIEKKVLSTLETTLGENREKYEKFWTSFGVALKHGIYSDFMGTLGVKDKVQDLLMFKSLNSDKLITLAEYIAAMKGEQKYIYYASGESETAIKSLPQMELLKDKGYDVILLTEKVDEFAIEALSEYKEKTFRSITKGDLELSEEEKKQAESLTESNKDLLTTLKESLGEKVGSVKISNRLKNSPVCLVTDEHGISLEMEKIMAELPSGMPGMKANKILEINPTHPIFTTLQTMHTEKKDLTEYADLLYTQALLIEGFPIENPTEFAQKIANLMVNASK